MYKFSSLTSNKMPELGSSLSGICVCKNTGGLFPITQTTIYCKPQSSINVLSFKKKTVHSLSNIFWFWNFNYIMSTLLFPPSKLSHTVLLALSNAWPLFSLIAVICKYVSTYTFLNTTCSVYIMLSVCISSGMTVWYWVAYWGALP